MQVRREDAGGDDKERGRKGTETTRMRKLFACSSDGPLFSDEYSVTARQLTPPQFRCKYGQTFLQRSCDDLYRPCVPPAV